MNNPNSPLTSLGFFLSQYFTVDIKHQSQSPHVSEVLSVNDVEFDIKATTFDWVTKVTIGGSTNDWAVVATQSDELYQVDKTISFSEVAAFLIERSLDHD